MQRYIYDEDDVPEPNGDFPKKEYTPRIVWEVGDTLISKPKPGIYSVTNEPYDFIYRKIAAVRPTGYSWYYPEWDFETETPGGRENHFISENSSDPFLENWNKFKPDGEV